jgi:hypothetical protein
MAVVQSQNTHDTEAETVDSGLRIQKYKSDFLAPLSRYFRLMNDSERLEKQLNETVPGVLPKAEFWSSAFYTEGILTSSVVIYFSQFETIDLNVHVDMNEVLHQLRCISEGRYKVSYEGCRICAGVMNRIAYEDESCWITAFDGSPIKEGEMLAMTRKPAGPTKDDLRNKFCWWPKGNKHMIYDSYDGMSSKFKRARDCLHARWNLHIHIRQNAHFHVHVTPVARCINLRGIMINALELDVIHACRMAHQRLSRGCWDHKHAIDIMIPCDVVYDQLSGNARIYYLYLLYMVTTHYVIGRTLESIASTQLSKFLFHPNVAASMKCGAPVISQYVYNKLRPYYPKWPAWVIVAV